MNIIPLSQLNSPDLTRLAALHQSVMHTLLSELGLSIVRRYYQVCQNDATVIGFCAISSSGEMLGWVVGSPHPDQVNARLRLPVLWFIGQMLRLGITRPHTLIQLAQSTLSADSANILHPEQIELTYIGVAPSARGQGLGKALLVAFADASRAAGYHSVVLSVETDNPEPVALYTKAGFTITRTFKEGRFERHRMELML